MADEQKTPGSGQQSQPQPQPQRTQTTAAAEPQPRPDRPDPSKPDETRPGGLYIATDRETVIDAEGRPVKGFSVKDGQIVGTGKAD